MRNRIIKTGALLLLASIAVCVYSIIHESILLMKTWDTIARVELCIGHVISESEPMSNNNIMEKMKKEFPDEDFKDGDVLDAWGQPIRLDIKHSGTKTTVSIKSACRRDGIFNESSIESVINISISEPYISTVKCEAQGNKSTDRGQP